MKDSEHDKSYPCRLTISTCILDFIYTILLPFKFDNKVHDNMLSSDFTFSLIILRMVYGLGFDGAEFI